MTVESPISAALVLQRRSFRWERGMRALWITVVVVTLLTLIGTMSPALALVPIAIAAGVFALARLPVHHLAVLYVFLDELALVLPRQLPDDTSVWHSPLYPLYRFFSGNLSEITGIGALKFSGSEAVYLLFGALIITRALGEPRRDAEEVWGARIVRPFAVVMFAAIVWLEIWGIARGGADIRQTVWQMRILVWLPLLVAIFAYAVRTTADLRHFVIALTLAAIGKIAIGMYFVLTVARPAGFKPESFTSHHDSVLYVVVAIYWLANWAHRRSARSAFVGIVVFALMMLALAENNRRTAFVSLVGSMFAGYTMLEGRLKRRLTMLAICALPFVAAYILVGSRSSATVFRPAAMIMSVSQQKDVSSQTRDIENFNLSVVISRHTILGTGWGYEYEELVKVPDISKFFQQYLFIAHNSVLWLLGIAGEAGFPMIWMLFVVTVFLAARGYRFARGPDDRTAAVWIVSAMIAYAIQAWADMGTQGETIGIIAALAIAASAKLAHETGAWPSGIRLLPRQARAGTAP